VDWVKLPKNDDAFDAVDKAWLEQGGRVVSHYLKAISIVGCDEPHVFPADRGRQLASMLAYSKPGGMGSFTEFVHNQARARPLTVEHAAITQKMMNQLGPKTLIGMLKSA
jgi:hypothetical protein